MSKSLKLLKARFPLIKGRMDSGLTSRIAANSVEQQLLRMMTILKISGHPYLSINLLLSLRKI